MEELFTHPNRKNCHRLDDGRCFDDPLTEQEIKDLCRMMSSFDGKPYIEEFFCGNQSVDFYRGLLAGYYHSMRIKQQRDIVTWVIWVHNICQFFANKLKTQST